MIIPVSVIIPTAHRHIVLKKTILSIRTQAFLPKEIIIIDASADDLTKELCASLSNDNHALIYIAAKEKGAAVQRSQGVDVSAQPFIYFMDDDIELQENCIEKMWDCLQNYTEAGGVNAMITNQQYHSPGKATRFMYRLMSGKKLDSYAGKCIGPAWNLLPQDAGKLINETEWLNTTCTLYRKDCLPTPLFPAWFNGYSLMEDLALSLTVAKKWKLYNVRDAKIFHDSQPGIHKKSVFKISKMELMNRHFIMVRILGRSGLKYHLKLILFESWGLFSKLRSIQGIKDLFPDIAGKIAAAALLLVKKK